MVRNYKPGSKSATGKKYEAKYIAADMARAIEMVVFQKIKVYNASKKTGILCETLRRRIIKESNEAFPKKGRKPVFTDYEEQLVVTALKYCAKHNHPQDREDIADTIQNYVTSLRIKTKGRPGKDWMIKFIRRHSAALRPRKPEILTKARADALTKEVIEAFFDLITKIYDIVK